MTATHNPQPTPHNPSPVPRLDLAPKRTKPLSLWNPLDYLTLLYWIFFFPQALRWYVETFGKPEYQKKAGREVWQVLRCDLVQRRLLIQALLTLLLAVPGIALVIQVFGIPIAWNGVVIGMAAGVTVGWLGTSMGGPAGGKQVGIAFGIANGLVFGVTVGITLGITDAALGLTLSIMLGVMGGMFFSVNFGVEGGVAFDLVALTVGGAIASAGIALLISSIEVGLAFGCVLGISLGLSFILTAVRLPEWVFAWVLWPRHNAPSPGTRLAWLPLPGFRRQIEDWLRDDWQVGVHNINELLAYSLQFIPAASAVSFVLADSSRESLLPCVNLLAEKPFDWILLRLGSGSFVDEMRREFFLRSFFSVESRRRYFPAEPRLDTPVTAACAGFWYWHEKQARKAMAAFAIIQDLPHGLEIYGIAKAIVTGQQMSTLQDLAAWDGVGLKDNSSYNSDALRPGTLRALRILGDVAAEASTAHCALAPLNRATAIGRANAALTHLLETGAEFCPEPEWPLIEEIVKKWRDIVSKAGGVIGLEVLRQPVLNPYEGSSGLPVTGPTFVGRKAIITQIERHWAIAGPLPPLILYGHRRMGKSSILRNLDKGLPPGNLLVYLDMQDSGFVNHTGELLLDIAEAIYKRIENQRMGESANGESMVPNPTDYATLGSARRALNTLLESLAPQMQGRRLILAIDEFEVIQDGIDKGRIEPEVLSYLRSRIQAYHWLALIFAGLHQLDEIGRDYKSVFYGQAEHIRVSYLSEADALNLIARPHPDFALEYAPELRAELYRLTYGQPYLLQRLCWELVERWNERFLREGESTPRELALDELPPILTPDFYYVAGYYFDGLWYKNLTENERAVLRVMARRETPWMRKDLAVALPATDLDAVFVLLKRHDVVLEGETGVRFASELLRRWIVQFSTD